MTLLVSDEHDLLEANLDYHLARGVDFVIVTADRGGPAPIAATARRYVERGVCHLIEDDPSGFVQGEWITRMARMAAADFGADWVINADVDEFYWPEAGTLKGVFATIPERFGTLTMPVSHFVPRPGEGFFADRMVVRETLSLKSGGPKSPVATGRLTKVAHRGAHDVEVSQGGHRATGTGLAPLVGWEPILGLHFPLRSYAQFESKVRRDGNTADAKIRTLRSELHERHAAGRLADLYADRVVDDAGARSGVEEGRLVVDERLKRFFAAADRAPPAEPTLEEVESLRSRMERAVEERRRHPLAAEVRHLEERLEITEGRFARLQSKRRWADAQRERLREERDAARRELKRERRRAKDLGVELDKVRRRSPLARVRELLGRRGRSA